MLYGINYCSQAPAAAIPPVVGRVGQVKTVNVCISGGWGKLESRPEFFVSTFSPSADLFLALPKVF